AGYFEGDFNDTGSPAFLFPGGTKTGTIHNFGTVGSPVNGDIVTATGNVYNLAWAVPLGGSSNDYDLFLVSSAGVIKAQSTNIQNGPQNPLEQITPPALAAGDRLVVFKSTAAASLFFAINTLRGTLTTNTPGQTHGHSAAQGVGIYSVAATPAAAPFGPGSPTGPFPNPFSTSNSFELFTSDGPRRIFFNADGSAITPGNFSSNGGTVRSKPDITAADGVSTTLPGASGLNPFYGTSAAAPHAASVAALIKSAKPAITQTEMRTALTSTAIDIGTAGNDRDSGAGIVMAFEAIDSLGVAGTADPLVGTVTAVENPGNGNGVIEAGEGGKVTVQLKNVGVVDATGITTTLTTSTPGVTITLPGTSAYPNLTALGGAGTNATPFTFTVASNADCALNINFTLTVNYTGGPQRVSSFNVQTGLVTLANNLGTLPAGTLGVTTATGQQTNRITRNGVVSACGTQKLYPGTTATTGTRTFDSYTFNACKASCVTPVLTSSNGANIFEEAYAGGFIPATISTNYAGDAGGSGSPQSFGISTTAGTAYTIVVNDVPGTATGSSYSLQLPACQLNCNINQVPIAVAQNVTVVAPIPGGSANANINNGSSDPDGDAITITQTPAGPYPHGNTTVLLTVTDTKGATAQASAVVTVTDVIPPAIIVSFGAASIPVGGSTSLSFTVQNTGTSGTLTGIGFSDVLPAGLVISTPNGLTTTTCGGGTITAAAGTNSLNLSGATLVNGTSCTFAVNVTGTIGGTKNNTTGNITSNESGAGGTGSATLTVVAPPLLAKAFNPAGIPVNGTTSLTFTITNTTDNTVSLSGVAFTDTLPTGLTVASASATPCGGTLTTTAPTGIALTGATIAAGSQCLFSVTVTGTTAGSYTNTTGAVTSTNGGTGNTASANLSVAVPPTITKSFGAATIPLSGTTSLTFHISNPINGTSLTGLEFTDSLPAGMIVASTPALSNTCGGVPVAIAGAEVVSFSGGTLASNASCTVSVNVGAFLAGVKNNSVTLTSFEAGTSNTSSASLTVIGPPSIGKAFGAATIPLNGSTSLSFTLQNNNTISASGVAFTDTLPAGMVVSTPNGFTGSCGSGTITATAGSGAVSLSGGTVAASSSCTFAVNVTGTTVGTKNNTTGAVTSTEGGPGGTASASTSVLGPPSIAAAFNPASIAFNATSALTFTITNPAANTAALTGVA
ncbi:MAG TPA: hypothetical protein VHA06_22100, partial [Candidatus Angelobacter sp.]|nr:hypothetical protein [Candidatus Angelobacter sp.]